MTLTYRGKQYVRIQGAGFDSSKKALLTYRGIPYAKWGPMISAKDLCLTVGVFLLVGLGPKHLHRKRNWSEIERNS